MSNLITYFEMNFGKIFIEYNKLGRRLYKKEVNGEYINLTRKEFDVIEDLFEIDSLFTTPTILSEKLLTNNTKISPYIKQMFNSTIANVEEFISREMRVSFYNNLINVNIRVSNINDVPISMKNSYAYYSGYKNELVFVYENIIKHYNKLLYGQDGKKNYRKFIEKLIAHELFHMSSFVYSSDNDSYQFNIGVVNLPNKLTYIHNTGLNEAITEKFAIECVNYTKQPLDSYYMETVMLEQLLTIVKKETIVSTYFNNNTIKPIVNDLMKYTNSPNQANRVFTLFEEAFISRKKSLPSNAYANYQSSLINFLLVKCSLLNDNDEINQLIESFESHLITNELLTKANIKHSLALELDESITLFYNFKNLFYTQETEKSNFI